VNFVCRVVLKASLVRCMCLRESGRDCRLSPAHTWLWPCSQTAIFAALVFR